MRANIAIQTINPMPAHAYDKTIAYDGQRAAAVIAGAGGGAGQDGGGGYSGNCLHASNTDSAGNNCGGRSADSRAGGKGAQ